jgi:hypothetical protein
MPQANDDQVMHGQHDGAAQIVGASELGEPYDVNQTH